MEAKYEDRKQELLNECTVVPEVFTRVIQRLEKFMQPFVESLLRKEQVAHASTFVQGLLSDLDHKNTESVGVKRQWCGRLGKIDTGDHGSTSPRGHQRHPETQLRMRYSLSNH